ncbi:MAG TPA: hypothetical protein VFV38_34120, partial [Ktedonobacteraceae bacterium]|nr:hypothetical protein [Ktedonobacteraceae bacterium]
MNDLMVIPSEEEFETQAKLHDSIRDGLQTFVSNFDPRHNDIVSNLDKDQVALYTQWWNNLRSSLIAHANLHDQLGQRLRKAKEAYYN